MKTFIPFVSFLLIFSICSFAQKIDPQGQIGYVPLWLKQEEQSVWTRLLQEPKISNWEIWSATDPQLSSTYEQSIAPIIQKLDAARIQSKPIAKQVKLIHKVLHKELFKRYVPVAYWGATLREGTYNCVTSTVVMGLILEHYDIPFSVLEEENHVLIKIKPEKGSPFVVETTDGERGFIQPSSSFKSSFIETMTSYGILSSAFIANYTEEELFTRYFYFEKEIDLRQLAGLQFFNLAYLATLDRQWEQAQTYYEKGLLLYTWNERGEINLLGVTEYQLVRPDWDDMSRETFLTLVEAYQKMAQ
ncbi:MAG: hypothetical protein AAFR59_19755, partial [Bacteroidota bacterium]